MHITVFNVQRSLACLLFRHGAPANLAEKLPSSWRIPKVRTYNVFGRIQTGTEASCQLNNENLLTAATDTNCSFISRDRNGLAMGTMGSPIETLCLSAL